MPTPYVRKMAKKHHKTTAEVEKMWDDAKRSAEHAGHKDDYAYVTGVLKKMLGEGAFTDASNSGEMVDDASPVSEDSGLRDELEARFGSGAAQGEHEEDGESVFPDGSASFICTNWAMQVRDAFGAARVKIVGFDENEGACAEGGGGHDFAIVDGRYIVDGWAKDWEGSADRAVHDLQDPADADEIARLYGPREGWETVGVNEATTTDDLGQLPPTAGPGGTETDREWEKMLRSHHQESRLESIICSIAYGDVK